MLKVHRDCKVLKVYRVQQVHRVLMELRELRVCKVLKVQMVPKVSLVLQEPMQKPLLLSLRTQTHYLRLHTD